MTEEEWLTSSDCRGMYAAHVRRTIGVRRIRLFMVACCRLFRSEFFDPRIGATIDAGELAADDPTSDDVLVAIRRKQYGEPPFPDSAQHLTTPLANTYRSTMTLLRDVEHDGNDWRHGLAHAASYCLSYQPASVSTHGGMIDHCVKVLDSVARRNGRRETPDAASLAFQEAAANILRDIFGNPFRPVALDHSWLTEAVVGISEGIYDDRAFERLPILADALQDAGCEDERVLSHCREPGTHVRGCWVLDLLLGRE